MILVGGSRLTTGLAEALMKLGMPAGCGRLSLPGIDAKGGLWHCRGDAWDSET